MVLFSLMFASVDCGDGESCQVCPGRWRPSEHRASAQVIRLHPLSQPAPCHTARHQRTYIEEITISISREHCLDLDKPTGQDTAVCLPFHKKLPF